MQQLDLLVGPKHLQAISNWDKEELVSQLSDLCDSLLAEGFRWQDIQEALQVTPQQLVHDTQKANPYLKQLCVCRLCQWSK